MSDRSRPAFAVVTDSTADIEPQMALDRGIAVVPLSVRIGDETYPDGQLTQVEFFEKMNAAPKLPTTSQPSVGAFVEAYEQALERADRVVSVHISNKLSGTVESARQAAERFAGKVHVFDTLNLSWGEAMQVTEAARAAAEGLGVEAAMRRLEHARETVRMIVGFDGLENLARGGRIGRVGAFMGGLLNLKVTITVGPDGAFVPVARTRGEKAALDHTLKWVAAQMGTATRARFAVGYMLEPERAHWLADQLRQRFDVAEMVVYATGSVIATHTGTGWGVTVLPVE